MTTVKQEATNDGAPVLTSSPSLDRTVSETNLPLGQLRYENWKMINNLLAWAEMHDQAYEKAVDEAIAAGVAPPSRERVLKSRLSESARSVGLSDKTDKSGDTAISATGLHDLGESRNTIRRLRGML